MAMRVLVCFLALLTPATHPLAKSSHKPTDGHSFAHAAEKTRYARWDEPDEKAPQSFREIRVMFSSGQWQDGLRLQLYAASVTDGSKRQDCRLQAVDTPRMLTAAQIAHLKSGRLVNSVQPVAVCDEIFTSFLRLAKSVRSVRPTYCVDCFTVNVAAAGSQGDVLLNRAELDAGFPETAEFALELIKKFESKTPARTEVIDLVRQRLSQFIEERQ